MGAYGVVGDKVAGNGVDDEPGSPFEGMVKAADELSGIVFTEPSSLPFGVATGVPVGEVEPFVAPLPA